MGSSIKDGSEHSGSNQAGDHVGDHGSGSSRRVRFEDILKMVGENGRWQIVIYLFTWIEGVLIGMQHLSSTFLGASMDHWCNTSHMTVLYDLGWTKDQIKQFAIPMDGDKPDSCNMYNLTELGSIGRNFESAIKSRPEDLGHISCEMPGIPERESWEYDQTEGIKSIVNDWDLVCERLPLLSTIQASYMGGVFVGCVVFGWASDRYGRRPTILVSALIQVIASVCAAFCTSYMTFVFFRFFIAFSVSGVFECGFVLVMEICGPKFRAPFGILAQFPFGIGASLLPLIAYFIRDWDTLQLAISIPSILSRNLV